MSERKVRQHAQAVLETRMAGSGRFGASFWDGVESEIEALDPADFALFLRADRLAIEPRHGFERNLETHLRAVVRRRWSN
jgi:hypothetical protein